MLSPSYEDLILPLRQHPPHYTPFTPVGIQAHVHVELAPRRREAVVAPGRRTGGVVHGGEHGPVHGGGVEDEQVVKEACG